MFRIGKYGADAMSMISRTSQYALRAMTILATREDRISVMELARVIGAPKDYLARIVMALASAGIIDARRGPKGGIRLGRKPGDITLMEIITCFDGQVLFEECCLGLPGCGQMGVKCPIHDEWGMIREKIRIWWLYTTLADFSADMTNQCMFERVPDHE
jgi:Rrf2 family protein